MIGWLAQTPFNPNLPKGDPNDPWVPVHGDRLEAMRDHWPDAGVSGDILVLLFALGLLVGGLILTQQVYRWMKLRSQPLGQFNEVARRLGLTARQRWLIWRIARHQGLPSPLALVLAPGTLYHHASRWAAGQRHLPDRLKWKPIHSVGERLFGEHWVEIAATRPVQRPTQSDRPEEGDDHEYRNRSENAPALA